MSVVTILFLIYEEDDGDQFNVVCDYKLWLYFKPQPMIYIEASTGRPHFT